MRSLTAALCDHIAAVRMMTIYRPKRSCGAAAAAALNSAVMHVPDFEPM